MDGKGSGRWLGSPRLVSVVSPSEADTITAVSNGSQSCGKECAVWRIDQVATAGR